MKNFLSIHENEQAYEDAQNTFDYPHVAYLSTEDELVYAESEPTHDYSLDYFTIEAIDDNLSFQIGDTENPTLYFSLDDGATWTNDAIFSLSSGEKALLKNTGAIDYETSPFEVTGGRFNLEGNIMSLIYGDDFADKTDFGNYNEVFRQFADYTGVVNAGNLVLPATTLRGGCYESMFEGCTSLTTAPVLPATTLDVSCYSSMFLDCTSLTTAPELPATTLADYCYQSMFAGCTSLTTALELPATTLTERCYASMFENCTGLTAAPELPATTLAIECYSSMFAGCTSLTTAPELPAATLDDSCYRGMFYGCTSLSYIKMLATDISASECLTEWVVDVSETGTFVKDATMEDLEEGDDGIPSGWTVIDA